MLPKAATRVYRDRQKRRGHLETGYLRASPPPDRWVSPDLASPAEPVLMPMVWVCHCHTSSNAILLSPQSSGRFDAILHSLFRVRQRILQDARDERAVISCYMVGVTDGSRP